MKQNEIRSFTGIRALALFGVVLYHLYPHVVSGGYLGVVVFFALSGYLLMRQHLQNPAKKPYLKLKKQYIKLTPPLLLVVSTTTLIALLFYPQDVKDVALSGISAIAGINNWQQIFRGLSYFDLHGKFLPFTHFWAMSAQMQFYLIWAILRHRFGKNTQKLAVALAALAAASILLMTMMTPFVDDATRVYYGTDTRFFSFALGGLFAIISEQGIFKAPQKNKSAHAAILTLLMLPLFLFFKEGACLYYGGMLAFNLMICFLMAFIAKDDNATAKVLANPILRYFGERSYEYYLWQYPLMLVFRTLASHTTLSYHLIVLIQLPVLALLSEGTYRLFKGKFKQRITRGAALVLALATIIGMIFIKPAPNAEAEIARETKRTQEKMQEDTPNTTHTDADNSKTEAVDDADLSEEIQQINANWHALALDKEDLRTLSDVEGFMLGDSITQMCEVNIKKLLPKFTVDGLKNRQVSQAKDIVDHFDFSTLPKNAPVVLQLGTNSDFDAKTLDALIASCGKRPVYLVNIVAPDPWEASVNNKLKDAADASANVHLIDWYGIAKEQQDLFISDHTHPKGLGLDLFAQTVAKHVLPKKKTPTEKETSSLLGISSKKQDTQTN